MSGPTTPTFWRDPALPWLEARAIDDGRGVCYARHAHETFSIGQITAGANVYLNGGTRQEIGAGTVVLMNPGDTHACNPLGDAEWSYRMFYVDARWLGGVQRELGLGDGAFRPYVQTASRAPALYAGLSALYATCVDPHADTLARESAALDFFGAMHAHLAPSDAAEPVAGRELRRAAELIRERCMEALRLDEISTAAGLSPSYLIRAFKQRYGMTPHAYLVNCRIQLCRQRLKLGEPIADVALAAGFADQAHLQRAFKRHVAATPGQYRRA